MSEGISDVVPLNVDIHRSTLSKIVFFGKLYFLVLKGKKDAIIKS
jgi:hypothetical protein